MLRNLQIVVAEEHRCGQPQWISFDNHRIIEFCLLRESDVTAAFALAEDLQHRGGRQRVGTRPDQDARAVFDRFCECSDFRRIHRRRRGRFAARRLEPCARFFLAPAEALLHVHLFASMAFKSFCSAFEKSTRPSSVSLLQSRERHRVHRVAADQRLDVEHVAVRLVLGAGRGPERPLPRGALCRQRLPARRVDALQVDLISLFRVGDGDLSLQVLDALGLEQLVDGRVDAADEETGDAVDLRNR